MHELLFNGDTAGVCVMERLLSMSDERERHSDD